MQQASQYRQQQIGAAAPAVGTPNAAGTAATPLLSAPPPPPPPEPEKPKLTNTKGAWQEYTTPDGRVYYYNTSSNQTVWSKPDIMKTLREKIMDACVWKANKAPDGKSY